jgi:hypothetical protein
MAFAPNEANLRCNVDDPLARVVDSRAVMISLICSNCSHTISVDEGFAGGVCRCVHCGAIQTVPDLDAAKSGKPAFGGKTLYQKPSEAPTGDLGKLSRAATVPTRTATAKPKSPSMTPIVIGAIAAAAVGAVAVAAFVLRGHSSPAQPSQSTENAPTGTTPSGDRAPTPQPTTPNRPGFGAIDLSGPTVVYLLDRGDATAEFLPELIRAAAGSARSLGPATRFQVVFWTSDDESPAFPAAGPTAATAANVASVLQQMKAQVGTSRATNVMPALDVALGQSPAEIVLATGKGASIDDELAGEVLARIRAREATGSRRVKVHVVDLQRNTADEQPSPALQRIASATSGVYVQMDDAKLDEIGGR